MTIIISGFIKIPEKRIYEVILSFKSYNILTIAVFHKYVLSKSGM